MSRIDPKHQKGPTSQLHHWLTVRDSVRSSVEEWNAALEEAGYRPETRSLARNFTATGFHSNGKQIRAKTAGYVATSAGVSKRSVERFTPRMERDGWLVRQPGKFWSWGQGKRRTPLYALQVPGARHRASFGPRKAAHAPVIDAEAYALWESLPQSLPSFDPVALAAERAAEHEDVADRSEAA